ncbi:MAG: hypothetical protein ACTSWA_11985, partial [Candidatus Thorarchaeota archaeon]
TFYMSAAAATGGHWENGPHLFSGGTYSGMVTFGDYGFINHIVTINITASGPTIDSNGVTEVDSLSLRSIAPMGTYMMNQKVDGVWGEPVVGRDPARTGGLWTDSAVRSDYEYVSNVPSIPYPSSTGTLSTNGEYYTITSIPGVGSDWHGPSFIQTLPSYFKLRDFGSFSANLSFIHGPNGLRKGQTCVSLYDENMQIALSLMIADDWDIETGGDKQYFSVIYYNEAGVATTRQSDIFTGDISGIVTVRYDTEIGLHWKAPGESDQIFMTKNNLNVERLIKYVGISSYRYGWRAEHDERIYNIRLSYAASEYTVFHDSCNDMNNFYRNLDFGYGTSANGTFVVPAGESYITLSNVDSGTSWHGPNYVHVLDRPFRLYQLTDFSVTGGIVQNSNTPLGRMYVALFDENKQITLLAIWGDSWSGDDKSYFYMKYYPQNGGVSYQHIEDIQGSFEKTGKLWWDESSGGQGAIYSTIDGSGSGVPISECYNASRVIKYVVLLGYQYSTLAIADMRIQDINVVADPNKRMAPPPFVDDCSDNDNFPLDNGFPWGTRTYGELAVGSGYLYPSAIPSSPTGWHGPNFVHVLSNPFELKDLSEFSVELELDQHSSQMGVMYIALFDENMQIVMLVYTGDSWVGSSKGYFHVVYYPEGGGSAADTTGYIYSSIHRTGKLWVNNGDVQYDIAGIQSGNLGAVANPHRTIKYIVIRAQRSGYYSLSDLRLHNIVVSEGLPTVSAPMYADGTIVGNNPDKETESSTFVNSLADQTAQGLSVWWTGWWPQLHLRITGGLDSGAYYICEIVTDILGFMTVEDLVLETPEDDHLSESDHEAMAIESHKKMAVADHENILWDVFLNNWAGTLFGIAEVSLILIDILTALLVICPTALQLTTLYALQIVFAAAYVLACVALWDGLLSRRNDAASILNGLFFGAALLVGDGILAYMSSTKIWGKYWSMRGANNWGGRAKFFALYSVFSVGVKIILLGLTFGLMIRCVELWFLGY